MFFQRETKTDDTNSRKLKVSADFHINDLMSELSKKDDSKKILILDDLLISQLYENQNTPFQNTTVFEAFCNFLSPEHNKDNIIDIKILTFAENIASKFSKEIQEKLIASFTSVFNRNIDFSSIQILKTILKTYGNLSTSFFHFSNKYIASQENPYQYLLEIMPFIKDLTHIDIYIDSSIKELKLSFSERLSLFEERLKFIQIINNENPIDLSSYCNDYEELEQFIQKFPIAAFYIDNWVKNNTDSITPEQGENLFNLLVDSYYSNKVSFFNLYNFNISFYKLEKNFKFKIANEFKYFPFITSDAFLEDMTSSEKREILEIIAKEYSIKDKQIPILHETLDLNDLEKNIDYIININFHFTINPYKLNFIELKKFIENYPCLKAYALPTWKTNEKLSIENASNFFELLLSANINPLENSYMDDENYNLTIEKSLELLPRVLAHEVISIYQLPTKLLKYFSDLLNNFFADHKDMDDYPYKIGPLRKTDETYFFEAIAKNALNGEFFDISYDGENILLKTKVTNTFNQQHLKDDEDEEDEGESENDDDNDNDEKVFTKKDLNENRKNLNHNIDNQNKSKEEIKEYTLEELISNINIMHILIPENEGDFDYNRLYVEYVFKNVGEKPDFPLDLSKLLTLNEQHLNLADVIALNRYTLRNYQQINALLRNDFSNLYFLTKYDLIRAIIDTVFFSNALRKLKPENNNLTFRCIDLEKKDITKEKKFDKDKFNFPLSTSPHICNNFGSNLLIFRNPRCFNIAQFSNCLFQDELIVEPSRSMDCKPVPNCKNVFFVQDRPNDIERNEKRRLFQNSYRKNMFFNHDFINEKQKNIFKILNSIKPIIHNVFNSYLSKPYTLNDGGYTSKMNWKFDPSDTKTPLDGLKEVQRPNHNLLHTLRTMIVVPYILSFFMDHANSKLSDSFSDFARKILGKDITLEELKNDEKLFWEICEKIMLCMLFSVVGRENDVGWDDNEEVYKSFREASGKIFQEYFQTNEKHFSKEELPIFTKHLIDMGNPENHDFIHIMINAAHKLDLFRCFDKEGCQKSIYDFFKQYVSFQNDTDFHTTFTEKLERIIFYLLNITGNQIGSRELKAPNSLYEMFTFPILSNDVDLALKHVENAMLNKSEALKTFLRQGNISEKINELIESLLKYSDETLKKQKKEKKTFVPL